MKPTGLFLLLLGLLFIAPLTASAESPVTPDCQDAQGKMTQAHNMQEPLELQREETQERVQHIYQDLFICHSSDGLHSKHFLHCQQLEQEGPKQFQAMLQLVTASHQVSAQLTTLARQVEKLCPAPTATASLTHISQLAIP